jgi:adenine/guanine phosphoribosyltransferase-like PRPP-binding protein
MQDFWRSFETDAKAAGSWDDRYAARMPDGRSLTMPIRDMGNFAMAGLIANQASFSVLDTLAEWLARAAAPCAPEIIVGLPTLGHTVGAATARALGHTGWVAPSTTRKRWYDDDASVALRSITSPATGANRDRRMWLDPRLLHRLQGRRVVLVDDVISTGSSSLAGLALLRAVGVEPVALLVAMVQGHRWMETWDASVPVIGAFSTPLFHASGGRWVETRPHARRPNRRRRGAHTRRGTGAGAALRHGCASGGGDRSGSAPA